MKRVNDHMDASEPNNSSTGDCCPSFMHELFQRADTATRREDVDHITESLRNLQGQCCKLIYDLSMNECIDRTNADDLGRDFVESDNNDLITFIAGVGVAYGDVVDRMAGFESSENMPKKTG